MAVLKKTSLIFVLVFLIYALGAHGQGNLIISEVAWMGTANSANDEWIEIYNSSSGAVDLTGWVLEATDGTPTIDIAAKAVGSATIPAGGFFLLERTDDTTVPGIDADVIYAGALSNSGEILILKDSDGNEVDRIDASSGWPAGDNDTKQTMQFTGSVWVTANPTPRTTNESVSPPPPSPPEPEPEPEPEPSPEPQPLVEETEDESKKKDSGQNPAPQNMPLASPVPPPTLTPAPANGVAAKTTAVKTTVVSTPQRVVQEAPHRETITKEDENLESQEALASVVPSVEEKSGGSNTVLWIVIIILLALNAGLLWVVRSRRSSQPGNKF